MSLKIIYPMKFQSLYPSEESQQAAANLWTMQLEKIEDKIIKRALNECPNRFTWIPEIAEFKQLCVALRGSEENLFYYRRVEKASYRAPEPSPLLIEYCKQKGVSWK